MPPVTNETQELEAVRLMIDERWSDCPVLWPNDPRQPPSPLDSGDPDYPARFVAVRFVYESIDRITFGGTNETRANLAFDVWVQSDATDERLRDVEQLLDAMVRTYGDSYGLQFTGNKTRTETVEADAEFPFCGRATLFEYVWFQEAE